MSATIEPVIRYRDIITAEITKILTQPAVVIAVVITFLANTLLGIVAANNLFSLAIGGSTVPLAAFRGAMFAPVYAFLVLPIYASGSEYHGGQFRVTLSVVPNRLILLASKLTAVLAVTVPAALIVLAPARLSMNLSEGTELGDAVLDLGRWLAAYVLMSVIAFGLAGLLRSTIASLSILILIPVLIATGVFQWPEIIRFLPDQASLSLLGTPGSEVTELPPGIAALVLTAWAVVLTLAYGATLARRDS